MGRFLGRSAAADASERGTLWAAERARRHGFGFPQLIAHAAKTRPLGAGTIIGSGTVANANREVGSSCIAERRAIETIELGAPKTPFLKFGDLVQIEMKDAEDHSIFGAIDQTIVRG